MQITTVIRCGNFLFYNTKDRKKECSGTENAFLRYFRYFSLITFRVEWTAHIISREAFEYLVSIIEILDNVMLIEYCNVKKFNDIFLSEFKKDYTKYEDVIF